MNKPGKTAIAVLAALAALDVLVWYEIFSGAPSAREEVHFLDVGQGDATLMILPGGVKVLTDAGADSRVRRSLEQVLSGSDRYIDLAIITHPELDHYGGFKELLQSYEFGAFLWNGRSAGEGSAEEWREIMEEIGERNVPLVVLGKGDGIRLDAAFIRILSPDRALAGSAELNDTGLVQFTETRSFKFLSTADVGLEVERRLARDFEIRADILKVGHHGSKYSSSDGFLAEARPRLAIVSAGRGNRYGHPAPEALTRLHAAGATVFRTDESGSISLFAEDGRLKVFVANTFPP